jgi:uroporphyrin-III C-methyltransferase / precorrin-2 dehydrogenase / sirohydrochlorin ferrochelatase
MDYFPIFLSLKDKPCLVVGAGAVAARKIELLLKADAKITVLAPEISPAIAAMQSRHGLQILQKSFEAGDASGYTLIVSATGSRTVNAGVAEAARQQQIPVNVVDTPELCDFIFPAIVDRSPLVAAISSGGVSPVLARLLRSKVESLIPAQYGHLAQLAEKFRMPVKQQFADTNQRRIFWENVLQGSIAELVFSGQQQAAETKLLEALQQAQEHTASSGEVYLVGAGPGDPDLLTFRALRLMQQADVVVYDRLVSPAILELVRRDAEKIYVGKQRDNHSLAQESINELLARLAKQGKRVVRLKGGDPFIFGRGGEEIETLMEQGVQFQVVPGITAANGCSSYAGIPLTHRDHAQSVTFVTGHLKDGSINLNWKQLAAPNQTIVIYMGLVGFEQICQALIANGCPATLPAAIVERGTTDRQRVITGTLATLPARIASLGVTPPTLIIIGSVVTLHNKLAWFKTQA